MSNEPVVNEAATQASRRRLEPADLAPKLKPFLRAKELEDVLLFWAPVDRFPMSFQVRTWWTVFMNRLKQVMQTQSLRQENFLQFKAVVNEQTERFLATSMEYKPLAGLTLRPGSKLPKPPTSADIEKAIQQGGFKIENFVGDYAYWFMKKQDELQRQDFFGLGGMIFLWLKADPNTKPPDLKLPAGAKRHMESEGIDLHSALEETYAFQDSFLKKSKEVFGQNIATDPSYTGVPFILPLLASQHFFEAGAEGRERWFQVFTGYCIESRDDKGVLLAVKIPTFEKQLIDLLEEMRSEGLEYPL